MGLLRLSIFVLFAAASGQAQMQNLSFETKSNTELKSAGWLTLDKPSASSLDSTVFRTGKFSMKLNGVKGMQSFSQAVSYNASDYHQLLLSAYIKTHDVKESAGLLVAVTRPNGKQGYVYFSAGEGLDKTSDWTFFSAPLIVEPGENKINVGGVIHGQGIAWFDDFELKSFNEMGVAAGSTINAYVGEYMKVLRDNALSAESVDMSQIEKIITSLTSHAQSKSDCYPAFRFGVKLLDDRHSEFFTPAFSAKWKNQGGVGRIELATGKLLEGGVAYVWVPAMGGGNEQDTRRYADSLQAVIKQLDEKQPTGWIIDLRDNSGGNCWPMLAGLGPLIENEHCATFVSRKGNSPSIHYVKGASRLGDHENCKVSKPYTLVGKGKRVAVLVSKRTASSGELVAVSFCQRDRTVLIGTQTSGLTTGNSMFPLSDGAVVNLTTSVYADRTGKRYPSGITPEIIVSPGEDALIKAIEWINQ